jgi:hypothetical protein
MGAVRTSRAKSREGNYAIVRTMKFVRKMRDALSHGTVLQNREKCFFPLMMIAPRYLQALLKICTAYIYIYI